MAHSDHAPLLGAVNGIATLDGSGKVPSGQIPSGAGGGLSSALTTMSGTLTLTAGSANLQYADPNGADRIIKLPSSPATSMYFKIIHAGAANRITVQDNGGTYLSSVYVGESGEFAYDGTQWRSSRELKFGLPSIAMWLEADSGLFQDQAGTTPAVANSDPVGLWKDQSEWGLDADDNANASIRPVLVTADLNGHPTVDFGTHGGANKFLQCSTKNFGLNGDCAIIAVCNRKWTSKPTSGVLVIASGVLATGGGPWLEQRNDANGPGNWSAGDIICVSAGYNSVNAAHAHSSSSNWSDADATWNLIVGYTSKLSGIRKNGVDVTNSENQGGVTYTAGALNGRLLVGSNGAAETWDGKIAALVMLTGSLSLGDIKRIERYLGAKYGITIP